MSEPRPRKAFLSTALILFGLLLAGGVALVWLQPQPKTPAHLRLPDGSTVGVAAVTFGTNHSHGGLLAKWLQSLPDAVQDIVPNLGPHMSYFSLKTPTPTLVVWLDLLKLSNSPPGYMSPGWFEVFLGDTNGFVSGPGQNLPFVGFGTVFPMQFSAFPRRERVFTLHVYSHDAQGKAKDCGALEVLNPAYHAYPQWQAEILPAKHRAGDVEATLEMFSTGHGTGGMSMGSFSRGTFGIEFPARGEDGENATGCFLRLRSLVNMNEFWRVDRVVLSDATSNRVSSTSMNITGFEGEAFAFAPGLWTNETAWKLDCEIKRVKGFAPNELFTFKNIPLGSLDQTSQYGWTTNFNGVTVTLDTFVRRMPMTNKLWSSTMLSTAHFSVSGATNDLYIDWVETRTDQGASVESAGGSSSSLGSQERWFLDIPVDAKTLDITFAVHQGRSVEFLVKPDSGPARFEMPAPSRAKTQ